MAIDNPRLPFEEPPPEVEQGGLTEAEKRQTFIDLVFAGDTARYDEFRQAIAAVVPAGTRAIVRGSAVTVISMIVRVRPSPSQVYESACSANTAGTPKQTACA